MRNNESTVLVGSKVVLVPYRKEHVDKYHQWMTDPHIREQTASEPLSIEEEYAMQKSWHLDADKLTFIVLARSTAGRCTDFKNGQEAVEGAQMAGDVNLFLSERHSGDDDDGNLQGDRQTSNDGVLYDAELEVMIAEYSERRKGLAREALGMLMYYATSSELSWAQARPRDVKMDAEVGIDVQYGPLPLARDAFVAKIGLENAPSIGMFTSMGFHEVKRSEIWKEAELRPDPSKAQLFEASIIRPLQILSLPDAE